MGTQAQSVEKLSFEHQARKAQPTMAMLLSVLLAFPLMVSSVPIPAVASQQKLIPNLSNSVAKSAKNLFNIVEDQENKSNNVIISPLSIHLAMSLLYNGAKGDSKVQLANVLGLVNVSDHTVQEEARNLLISYSTLKSNLTTNIELANVIFADDTTDVKDSYESILNKSFLTSTQRLNFSDVEESAETINDWVANKTNDLITDLVSSVSLSPDTRMMLLNAVYFRANWQLPFQKDGTAKSAFSVSEDTFVDADMMFLDNELYYGHNKELEAQVVSLQYEDPNFTMLLILPDNETALGSLSNDLTEMDFTQIHNSLNSTDLLLRMPKFKLGYKTQLVSAFKDMGIADIFDEASADLSGITDESLFVSDILHETKIEVNEEGSEAAGVTGIQLDTRAGGSGPLFLKIDRPFFFVIQDLKNNIPLFMGKILNPTDEDPISISEEGKPVLEDESTNFINSIPDENVKQNLVSIRSDSPEALLGADEMDPEERAHIKTFPWYEVSTDCHKGKSDKDIILFPCPTDTQPIEDYKKEHGDPARLGVNGENAALLMES